MIASETRRDGDLVDVGHAMTRLTLDAVGAALVGKARRVSIISFVEGATSRLELRDRSRAFGSRPLRFFDGSCAWLVRAGACGAWALLGGHALGAAASPRTTADGTVLPGATAALGDGRAASWVRVDAERRPTAMGVTFGAAALSGLPNAETTIVLPLPAAARLGFRTVVMDWHPQGHYPAGIYTVPHFDVHFYRIDERTRAAVRPNAARPDVTPAPSLVPLGFASDRAVVARMGLHYVSIRAPEFNGGRFGATPIYGYWLGRQAFIENMVALAYLQTRPAVEQRLPLPSAVSSPGAYPSHWSLAYDASRREYRVTFDRFVERS